jgi:very-short-patch-repair endonuclease
VRGDVSSPDDAVTRRNALVLLARKLRASGTDAENLLWQLLRSRQAGVKFRRQHPLGPYVLDLFSEEVGLVIEVDSAQHLEEEQASLDRRRTRFLRSRGLRVLRFDNRQVLTETEAVADKIWSEITRKKAFPSP